MSVYFNDLFCLWIKYYSSNEIRLYKCDMYNPLCNVANRVGLTQINLLIATVNHELNVLSMSSNSQQYLQNFSNTKPTQPRL